MNRQDAIINLNLWDSNELLFFDAIQVFTGELDMDTFLKKWEKYPQDIEFALHPDSSTSHLLETDYVKPQYDIAINKSPRYAPLFWHTHSFYEIVYVLSGTCDIYIVHDCLILKKGDFMMLSPHSPHQIAVDQNNSIILNIIIRSSTLLDIFLNAIRDKTLISHFLLNNTYGGRDFPYLLFHTQNDYIIRNYILDIYIELEESDEFSNRIATSLMTILFAQVVRHYSSTAQISQTSNQYSDISSSIMNYIINHHADCSLESIAQSLHYSKQYCSKIIKLATGMSFSDLLTRVRIEKAKNLLASTPMKVDDISEYLGYGNTETLIRVFKRSVGLTPSAYRKKLLTPNL